MWCTLRVRPRVMSGRRRQHRTEWPAKMPLEYSRTLFATGGKNLAGFFQVLPRRCTDATIVPAGERRQTVRLTAEFAELAGKHAAKERSSSLAARCKNDM